MKKWIMGIGIICLIGALYMLPVAFGERLKVKDSPATTEQVCEIFIEVEGQQEKIPLETYVTGVVAAEMPVSFKRSFKGTSYCSTNLRIKIDKLR